MTNREPPQIDIGTNYRRQDPETGEMKPPVDKRMMRWLGVVMTILAMYFVFGFHWEGGDFRVPLGSAIVGALAGGCFVLSLRRPDW